jgi:hypothetical protein
MTNPSPILKKSSSNLINRLAELESTIMQPSSLNSVKGVILKDEEKAWIINDWTSNNNRLLENTVIKKSFLKSPEGIQLTFIENTIKENKKNAIEKATGSGRFKAKFPRLKLEADKLQIRKFQDITRKKLPTGFQSK